MNFKLNIEQKLSIKKGAKKNKHTKYEMKEKRINRKMKIKKTEECIYFIQVSFHL